MSFGIGNNAPSLNFVYGQTKTTDLDKFADQLQAKGLENRELNFKSNGDGSVTISVAPAGIRAFFAKPQNSVAVRGQNQVYSGFVLADAVSRRENSRDESPGKLQATDLMKLPRHDGFTSAAGAGKITTGAGLSALLGRVDQQLKPVQKRDPQIDASRYDGSFTAQAGMTFAQRRDGPKNAPTDALNRILADPTGKPAAALGHYMTRKGNAEEFRFMVAVRAFNTAPTPQEKLKLGQALLTEFISEPAPGKTNSRVNISSELRRNIEESMRQLSLVPNLKNGGTINPEIEKQLNTVFQGALDIVEGRKTDANGPMGFAGAPNLARALKDFVTSPEFQAAQADTSRHDGSGADGPAGAFDRITAEPTGNLSAALQQHQARTGNSGADLRCMAALRTFENAATPHEKFAQAQAIAKEFLAPAQPGKPGTGVAISAEQRAQIQTALQELSRVPHLNKPGNVAPEIQQQLNGLFTGLQATVSGRATATLRDFVVSPEFRTARATLARNAPEQLAQDVQRAKTDRGRAANDALQFQAGANRTYADGDVFGKLEGTSAGGATGSKRVKLFGEFYQVKGSIDQAGAKRRLKAGGLDHENIGELIASNVARASLPPGERERVPQVQLAFSATTKETMILSRYVQGGRGDLNDLYRNSPGADDKPLGALPKGQKHVISVLGSNQTAGGGKMGVTGLALEDTYDHVAGAAKQSDHDFNPGNLVAQTDGQNRDRRARIDLGHAFGDLINAPGGRTFGGGGLHWPKNRIQDFFNRETVSGVSKSQQQSKLWRSFEGEVISHGLAAALRKGATPPAHEEGLLQSKMQLGDILTELDGDPSPAAQGRLQTMTKSLAKLSANVGFPVDPDLAPVDVLNVVFRNLDQYYGEQDRQSLEVADLCDLQASIDDYLNNPLNDHRVIPAEIRAGYEALLNNPDGTLKAEHSSGLNWMKMSRDVPAKVGDLNSYIEARRAVLNGNLSPEAQQQRLETATASAKKWSLDGILNTTAGRASFRTFIEAQHAQENLNFDDAVQGFSAATFSNTSTDVELMQAAREIETHFIHAGSAEQVNISSTERSATSAQLNRIDLSLSASFPTEFRKTLNDGVAAVERNLQGHAESPSALLQRTLEGLGDGSNVTAGPARTEFLRLRDEARSQFEDVALELDAEEINLKGLRAELNQIAPFDENTPASEKAKSASLSAAIEKKETLIQEKLEAPLNRLKELQAVSASAFGPVKTLVDRSVAMLESNLTSEKYRSGRHQAADRMCRQTRDALAALGDGAGLQGYNAAQFAKLKGQAEAAVQKMEEGMENFVDPTFEELQAPLNYLKELQALTQVALVADPRAALQSVFTPSQKVAQAMMRSDVLPRFKDSEHFAPTVAKIISERDDAYATLDQQRAATRPQPPSPATATSSRQGSNPAAAAQRDGNRAGRAASPGSGTVLPDEAEFFAEANRARLQEIFATAPAAGQARAAATSPAPAPSPVSPTAANLTASAPLPARVASLPAALQTKYQQLVAEVGMSAADAFGIVATDQQDIAALPPSQRARYEELIGVGMAVDDVFKALTEDRSVRPANPAPVPAPPPAANALPALVQAVIANPGPATTQAVLNALLDPAVPAATKQAIRTGLHQALTVELSGKTGEAATAVLNRWSTALLYSAAQQAIAIRKAAAANSEASRQATALATQVRTNLLGRIRGSAIDLDFNTGAFAGEAEVMRGFSGGQALGLARQPFDLRGDRGQLQAVAGPGVDYRTVVGRGVVADLVDDARAFAAQNPGKPFFAALNTGGHWVSVLTTADPDTGQLRLAVVDTDLQAGRPDNVNGQPAWMATLRTQLTAAGVASVDYQGFGFQRSPVAADSSIPEALLGYSEGSKALYRQLIATGQTMEQALDHVFTHPVEAAQPSQVDEAGANACGPFTCMIQRDLARQITHSAANGTPLRPIGDMVDQWATSWGSLPVGDQVGLIADQRALMFHELSAPQP